LPRAPASRGRHDAGPLPHAGATVAAPSPAAHSRARQPLGSLAVRAHGETSRVRPGEAPGARPQRDRAVEGNGRVAGARVRDPRTDGGPLDPVAAESEELRAGRGVPPVRAVAFRETGAGAA